MKRSGHEPNEQLTLFTSETHEDRRAGTSRLRVVRDRGLMWQSIGGHLDGALHVWTLREFFDRIRRWGLTDFEDAVRDDDVALWAAAGVLSRNSAFAVRVAPDVRTLYRALIHGGVKCEAICRALKGAEGRLGELGKLFDEIASVEQRMLRVQRLDGVEALSRGVEKIRRVGLPRSLQRFSGIQVDHPIDPSDLEIQALIAVAQSGMPVEIILPIDEGKRGLGEGVAWIADALEKAFDVVELEVRYEGIGGDGALRHFVDAWYSPTLMPAPDAPAGVQICSDQGEEARRIAGAAAAWRRSAHPPPRVAVALRTLDSHAQRIADAMADYGVPVRRRAGQRLSESGLAQVIFHLLRMRREGSPRERLLAVLSSPHFRGCLPTEQVGSIARLLRQAVARTDVEDVGRPQGGYAHRLQRFAAAHEQSDPHQANAAREALGYIEKILSLVYSIPTRSTVLTYLQVIRQLLREHIVDDDKREKEVFENRLDAFWRACTEVSDERDGAVDLAAFTRLFSRALAETRLSPPRCDDDTAVELLTLPELFGRNFDYVVVADCVHGRLPLAERLDPLLSDSDRRLVNQLLGRPVLRLHTSDPLEPAPVPRRQALELLWFAGAAEAAQKGLFLTAAARDARGREQAPSLFLQKSLEALGGKPDDASAGQRFPDEPPRRLARVAATQMSFADDVSSDNPVLDEADQQRILLYRQMWMQRAVFFGRDADTPYEEVRAPFAFAVSPERVRQRFGHQLGLSERKPLGPTRLEALAACRMRGFVEHLLGVDTWPFPGQDGDARHLGRLAHHVLETFLRERRAEGVSIDRFNAADQARLLAILDAQSEEFVERLAPGHQGALRANVEWLGRTLLRAMAQLARRPPVPGAEPTHFELKVGTRGWQESEGGLGPVPLSVGDESLWVGGEIDRVDEGGGARVVVDYKNSTAAAVIQKVQSKTLFKSHFQLPLYLRLLEYHRPTTGDARLMAYLVSLREGVASRVLGEREDLRRRILDDRAEDGLAQGIGRVLRPVLAGTMVPDVGAQCKDCRLVRVCRVPKARPKPGGNELRDQPVEGDGTVLLDRMWSKNRADKPPSTHD